MEVTTLTISLFSVAIAAWSGWYAHRANKRADQAEARDREYKDVRWHAALMTGPDAPVSFQLRNDGHTDAHDVVLLIDLPQGEIQKRFAHRWFQLIIATPRCEGC